MRSIALLIFLAAAASAQSFQRNDITFSGGAAWDVSTNYNLYDTPVSLGATYGYRITRVIEAEAGAIGAINPVETLCGYAGCFNPGSRIIWVPFGFRFILPLQHDRFELSAGLGGLYQSVSGGGATPVGGAASYNAFGGYGKVSAAVALDHGRHWWLEATPRILIANGQYPRDRWFLLTGDISFRF